MSNVEAVSFGNKITPEQTLIEALNNIEGVKVVVCVILDKDEVIIPSRYVFPFGESMMTEWSNLCFAIFGGSLLSCLGLAGWSASRKTLRNGNNILSRWL